MNDFWQTPITYLKKVGPQRAKVLASEANIHTYQDLLYYFPRKYVDKSNLSKISEITEEDQYVSLVGKITRMETVVGKSGKSRLTAWFSDGSGFIELVWFQGASFIKSAIKLNEEVAVFGRANLYGNMISISHPELDWLKEEDGTSNLLRIIPFYPSGDKLGRSGLDSRGFRTLIKNLFEQAEKVLPETLSPAIQQANNLESLPQALKNIHFPPSFAALKQAQRRIKFDEFFFFQLLLAGKRQRAAAQNISPVFAKIGPYFTDYYEKYLPFPLTNAQKRVLKEIRKDLARPIQMNRLVQGDVGSGKTIVAFMAMLMAKDNGFQSALMAPTEILAEQHYRKMKDYAEALDMKVALIVGGQRKKERQYNLDLLLSGEADITIGTHALIEDSVQFAKLGLVVVDEQHKFGVQQRAKLWQKGNPFPHNLVMTATPIPRTLAMTLYGDVDVSLIDELPPGRQAIKTIACFEKKRLEILGFLRNELGKGRQAYIVYPLVEESEKMDLLAVEKGYELMQEYFEPYGYRVGIVHGKMKADAKEMEMQRFLKRETHILVSTTVIEVGVDVPNASVMVIENAERFGLSQLHQLRGRVGRGSEASFCVLMTSNKRSADARERLKTMVETNDGFKIAEKDLEIRGPGDFLGTRQSGLPEFQLANITQDQEILREAREAAFSLADQDPQLQAAEHQIIRIAYLKYREKQAANGILA